MRTRRLIMALGLGFFACGAELAPDDEDAADVATTRFEGIHPLSKTVDLAPCEASAADGGQSVVPCREPIGGPPVVYDDELASPIRDVGVSSPSGRLVDLPEDAAQLLGIRLATGSGFRGWGSLPRWMAALSRAAQDHDLFTVFHLKLHPSDRNYIESIFGPASPLSDVRVNLSLEGDADNLIKAVLRQQSSTRPLSNIIGLEADEVNGLTREGFGQIAKLRQLEELVVNEAATGPSGYAALFGGVVEARRLSNIAKCCTQLRIVKMTLRNITDVHLNALYMSVNLEKVHLQGRKQFADREVVAARDHWPKLTKFTFNYVL